MRKPTESTGLRVLLVSCEFEPDASPQGLRWARLAEALAGQGWRVDVVTLARPGASAVRGPGLRIIPVFPGFYAALLRRWQARRPASTGSAAGAALPPRARADHAVAGLNWKGRLERRVRSVLGYWLYPDLRREAVPFLRRCVGRLVGRNRYALAILSHEPPLALALLDLLAARGVPVVADLGDPVCAIYTPRRWRRHALRLEAKVCERAAAVVATSEATLQLLRARHAGFGAEAEVIPQGFEPVLSRADPMGAPPASAGGDMRVVYTGRFYPFRDPTETIRAVIATPGVELQLAVPDMPASLDQDVFRADCIRVRRGMAHEQARALQATADVLLVVGNDDPAQTPGKLFEYFALPVPILYVARHPRDPGAQLVEELRRGLVARGQAEIEQALARLRDDWRAGRTGSTFDLSPEPVAAYAWPALARRYSLLMQRVAVRHGTICNDAPAPQGGVQTPPSHPHQGPP